jgi:hypothetical protein
MALSTVILWVHALCGVIWVGVCASFLLAAMALSAEAAEWRAFAARSAPRINRLCVALACLIPLTGIGNLVFAARAHHHLLPAAFVGVLSAKIGLFAAMALVLWMASRAGAAIDGEGGPAGGVEADATNIRRLVRLYALIVIMGAVALGLGLWLSGT